MERTRIHAVGVVLVVGALLGTALVSTPASAAGKPDLTTTSLAAPATAVSGNVVATTTNVKNRGKAKAPESTTRFYLSKDAKKSADDTLLTPARKVKALKPGTSAKVTASLAVPADLTAGAYNLVACADDRRKVRESNEGNNCRARPIEVTGPPSSFDLIDEALEQGEITQEQATTYEVFAAFADDRLPDRFATDDAGPEEIHHVLFEAAADFDSLSESAKTTLFPFFLPPFYEGSWHDGSALPARRAVREAAGATYADICNAFSPAVPSAKWANLATDNGKARVWWQIAHPEHEDKAQAFADEIDRLWPKLETAFGEPMPDGGSTASACKGPDGAIDVAIGNIPQPSPDLIMHGFASPFPNDFCPQSGFGHVASPVYLVLNAGSADNSVLVHEFAHAAQFAYTPYETHCQQRYAWLMEATATWFQDYVDPELNWEHKQAPSFLKHPDWPLDSFDGNGTFQYGAYLFPKYLTSSGSTADIIKAMWEEVCCASAVGAVEAALVRESREGFAKTWHEFSLWRYNREPFDHFKQTDSLAASVLDYDEATNNNMYEREVTLNGKRSAEMKSIQSYRPPLTASYHRITVADDVRYIEFKPELTGSKMKVQAVVKIDGAWKDEPQNWSSKKTFCRTTSEQKIDEVILIVSNGEHLNTSSGQLRLGATAKDSCGALEGDLQFTRTWDQASDGFNYQEDWSGTVKIRLDRNEYGGWSDNGSRSILQGTSTSRMVTQFCTVDTTSTWSGDHPSSPTYFLTDGAWNLRLMFEASGTDHNTYSGSLCSGSDTNESNEFFVVDCSNGVEATDPDTGKMTITFGPEPDYEYNDTSNGQSVQEVQNCTGVLSSPPEGSGG